MKIILAILIFACLILSLLPTSSQALDVPKLTGYVNDYARMISPEERVKLEQTLRDFERSDSTQVAILTVPSLEGESLDDYSIRVVEQWKLGQATKDNGVLLLVSKEDRKIRIEVGRGLEGRLTDLLAGRIIDLVITPRVKRGDYDGGFSAAVAALIDATRGEFQSEERPSPMPRSSARWFVLYILFFLFIVIFIARSRRSSGLGATRNRGGFPGPFVFWPLGGRGGWSSRGDRGGFLGGGGGGFGGGGGGSFGGGGASGGW